MDEFGDLRHVTTVGRLMEDDIDPIQRPFPIPPITDIAADEVDLRGDPGGFAMAVGLPLQAIQHTHVPALRQRRVHDVGAN